MRPGTRIRRRIAGACLVALGLLSGLVATHALDGIDLRADLLLAHAARRAGLLDLVRALYVLSSEKLFETGTAAGVVLALVLGRGRVRRLAFEVPCAAVGAELLARVLASEIGRRRPFIAHPALFMHVGRYGVDPSFPSDGATAAFAIATVVALSFRRLAPLALGLAGAIALERLLVAVHYPTDVLAGALAGVALALVVSSAPPGGVSAGRRSR
jgi:undecaprenyl-diphosphatase